MIVLKYVRFEVLIVIVVVVVVVVTAAAAAADSRLLGHGTVSLGK